MTWARHGHGMANVNQTRPHCVNQMGKTHSKPLGARNGRGTAWARHGHGMLCVNEAVYCNFSTFFCQIYITDNGEEQDHKMEVIKDNEWQLCVRRYFSLDLWQVVCSFA
jgi:hypothetical protein